MRATGIVRRIDDLGRVVIPKEIRRTMRIREGDPLEIYTDREGEVIFKKYSPIGEMNSFASQYAEALHRTAELCVVITDRDAVIAVSGAPRKSYADRPLSKAAEAGSMPAAAREEAMPENQRAMITGSAPPPGEALQDRLRISSR